MKIRSRLALPETTDDPAQRRNLLPRHRRGSGHHYGTTDDMKAVAALYAEDTAFESPTVLSVYPDLEEGILHGRTAVQDLFETLAAGLNGAFTELYCGRRVLQRR